MNYFNYSANRVFLVFAIFLSVFFAGGSAVYAQSSLETGERRMVPASEEVKIAEVKKSAENNYSDEKIHETLRSFFAMLFEKNYEGAAALMENRQKQEKIVSAMEKWRDRFMAPSEIKFLNQKKNADGSVTAVVTFQYKNANGVSDIMREKMTLSGTAAELKVRSFDSLNPIMMPAPKTVPTANVTPVTIPQNNSGSSSTDASSVINSLLSGSQGGSAPNITSLISAIGSNNSAASIDPGELLGLMTDMVNDPDVLALATNPKIMAIAKDPSIMSTLMSGNTAAAEADPRIKELLSDPGVQKIIEKMKAKRSGGGQSSPSYSPPSSVSESEMDKIFE